MSELALSDQIAVDPTQIESVRLDKKGAKISSKVVSVASGDWQDLTVPEDSLIVRLKDGSEFVIRGEQEAKRAWDALSQARNQHRLSFESSVSPEA